MKTGLEDEKKVLDKARAIRLISRFAWGVKKSSVGQRKRVQMHLSLDSVKLEAIFEN